MLKDRGSIKWTAMMLPEHVKCLRAWEYHEKNDEVKPEISDHQLSIMDDIMGYAMNHCRQVYISYYDQSIKKKVELYGEIKKIDPIYNVIFFLSEDGFSKRIMVTDIIELELR